MRDKTNWNAKAAREGERRREARPYYIDGVVVRYRRLYGDGEDKAAIIIEIPYHPGLVIGPLRSAIAKEVFDSIGKHDEVARLEIRVGDQVRVCGDPTDLTDHLDGKVGVVSGILDGTSDGTLDEYFVRFDDDRIFRIWSYNIVEVLRR